jgi:hypothetical protein
MATNPKMMNNMSEANRQSPNIIRQLNVLLFSSVFINYGSNSHRSESPSHWLFLD